MEATAKQVQELRKATGVGFLDCRKALDDSNGDFDKAMKFLREKGVAKAEKRANREASEGVLELYTHGGGRVGVMVEVNCETDFVARSEKFREFAHEIALQVAAAAPKWVKEDDIPEDVLSYEREKSQNWALEEGKPEKIIERIVEGRLNKYKEEVCLMRQTYIRDDDITIKDLLLQTIAAIGENIVIRRFVRWEVGESSET